MAVYAIGDIQGCYDEFRGLLSKISFNPTHDRLWLVGDLVNRGPQSLQTLEYVHSLGEAAICVLGNHDIHLIACYTGVQNCKAKSSLKPILESPNAKQLIDWMRHRPMAHYDKELNYLMVHAGVIPQWDLETTLQCAHEVEEALRSDDYEVLIQNLYGDKPNLWDPQLADWDRLRIITNVLTRIRYCEKDGVMNFEHKGPPGSQPQKLSPWFELEDRKSKATRIIFGHWSSLGLNINNNTIATDSGCLWGGQLSAVRIDCEHPELYSVDCSVKLKIQ